MPKLLIHEGGQQSVFELFDDETTIGRGAANVVQVADAHASKHQAVVRKVAGRMKLIDLESKNGTRVNGEFKNQRWLAHGDVVTIGAMTMTYDAEGATVAQAPVLAPPGRVLSSGAATSVATEAPSRSVAPRPKRARRPREDEDYDDEERGPRVPQKRGSNSGAVAIIAGAAVLGLIVVMMLIFSGSGNQNVEALGTAKEMYRKGRPITEARAYLVAHSNPAKTDSYVSVAQQIREWDEMIAMKDESAKIDEAKKVMSKIIFDAVEQWKNHISDEDFGRRLLKFLADYKGTPTAMELENSPYGDYPKLRAFIEKARAANK